MTEMRLHNRLICTHLVGVVGLDDEGIEVRVDVVLAPDVLVDQLVLALVAEDNVHFLSSGATDIRTYGQHSLVNRQEP